jgi:hypothetical protein
MDAIQTYVYESARLNVQEIRRLLMRRGEIWVAKHKYWIEPLQIRFIGRPFYQEFECRLDESDEWTPEVQVEILPECEWRPLEECEQRCTCGARVFPQHKHGCPAGGESWSK